jgi:hypothetical protein
MGCIYTLLKVAAGLIGMVLTLYSKFRTDRRGNRGVFGYCRKADPQDQGFGWGLKSFW